MSHDDLAAYYTVPGQQLALTGEDWTSDRDKKAQARREAARKRSGLACAKQLRAAATALNVYLQACNECRDGSGSERMGACDGRLRMIADLNEYACFLEGRYDK